MFERNPIHRTITITADWQSLGVEDCSNLDVLAATTNTGTVLLRSTAYPEDTIILIAGQFQDYAKDGVSSVNLASLQVKGIAGDKVYIKGEC